MSDEGSPFPRAIAEGLALLPLATPRSQESQPTLDFNDFLNVALEHL